MPDDDLLPTERAAVLVRRLTLGEAITTAQAARLVGVSRQAAWLMLTKLSRVLPIVQDRDGGRLVWKSIDTNLVQ
jgi:molybdenum-dependent DNA-binding transcriptional regulator ModE